ncbi:hypothetical protein [Clostridium homopropionicum]|uniref:hypothetical protein n=1 Tax=Clostridium homopropionicum TaxID=36844 RepID=UPI00068A8CDC|nr:hypothetical protein [Clostridium homopropionicum]
MINLSANIKIYDDIIPILNMSKMKKSKKRTNKNVEVWTEEQYEEYLKGIYGMEFIAGFTENGMPYGLFNEEIETYIVEKDDNHNEPDDELPF